MTSFVHSAGLLAPMEISRKFEPEDIESMFLDSGFDLVQHNQAENEYFSFACILHEGFGCAL